MLKCRGDFSIPQKLYSKYNNPHFFTKWTYDVKSSKYIRLFLTFSPKSAHNQSLNTPNFSIMDEKAADFFVKSNNFQVNMTTQKGL